MADYITRAKEVVANIKSKDQTVPGNAFLLDLAAAFIYAFRSQWEGFIASSDNTVSSNTPPVSTVINPANQTDPTDIGELDSDTSIFTALSAGDKNKLYAVHFIREMRRFGKQILVNYRNTIGTIVAGDVGETAEEFKAGVTSAAETESTTELGDPTNDPEA